MAKRRAPLFLKRKSYRRRRLRDAARLLPILGGFLVLLPILWSPSGSSGADTAWDGIYLFSVWLALVALAAALAPGLAHDAPEGDEADLLPQARGEDFR
ncbi:hypothetical protein [Paragemmobacter straminiformis]|uniref:Uncharacterized protein n=1 Tax=Paragemmobacter straminiformis TaxID=2045119 RepID=A0A842I5U3_9RHOB|nr:hypothetical protein [Gemmobacter straminiformis]MBC2835200.1 hypothetical protein [Gemmobacter straminiformis]